jgi:hypothetical protein
MFGFSHLPFSTSITKFLNGDEQGIILYINQLDNIQLYQKTIINITLTIEQDNIVYLS